MIRKLLSVTSTKGKWMILIAAAAHTIAGLLWAYLVYLVVDALTNIHLFSHENELYSLFITVFILLVSKTCMNIVADFTRHVAGFDVVENVRIRIVRKLKAFPLGFYSKERLGEISNVVHKDVDSLENGVGHFMAEMTSDIVIACVLGIWLFSQHVLMGFAMVSLLPLAVCVLVLSLRKNLAMQKQTNDRLADMVSLFVEYTKGIPLMKAFSENTAFQSKLEKSIDDFGERISGQSNANAVGIGQFSLLFELSYAVMVIVGAVMLLNNNLTMVVFSLFIIFSQEFYKPFNKLTLYWLTYMQVKDSYRRVSGIWDAPSVPQAPTGKKITDFDIAFENVSFSYEEDGFTVDKVSFALKKGTITALVGTSGSGKTTITSLLLRFWDSMSGTIKIGGVAIRDVDYDELLSNISIVMQNVFLFTDSLYENIRVGNKDATNAQIIAAAKKAQIHDFILSLPKGYDTKVGENGLGLSGGQKQRISIARAFLKNAPIVILDEITSNVDPINETKIQKAVAALAKHRTVLVIAHRLRTIQQADQILVFENGTLTERGTHSNLLSAKGLYARLWNAQELSRRWKIGR